MNRLLSYPFDIGQITRKRRQIKAELQAQKPAIKVRIALLGGSTTSELKDTLELFLLDSGIAAEFYESQYGKYEEEVVLDDASLREFSPQIAIVHTSWVNARFPPLFDSDAVVDDCVRSETARFEAIWTRLIELNCTVIQNNFDSPPDRGLGNLDATRLHGRANFLGRLNQEFASAARRISRLLVNDIAYQSSVVGLDRWHDRRHWFSSKLAVSPAGTVMLAHNTAAIIRGVFGKTRKCLILDLDNTVWGGVIGDDGLAGIRVGNETPEGEAYSAFQRYCLELKKRGVLLAVCSKNEPANAQEGFSHPDMILKLTDFAAFKASWGPKHEAIQEIAHELNIGVDSFVFVDDNPAERAIVSAQLPQVAVPDVGDDPSRYVELLDRQLYFEPIGISADDLQRTDMYASNTHRNIARAAFANYGEFLDSLEMKAEIAAFIPTYMERIAQLTNKSNQYNLTTKRCTLADMESFRASPDYVTLYGRLADKFGDNGLITVVVGRQDGSDLWIDLWLMSCRVLKRDMEHAMLDELVAQSQARNVKMIHAWYLPTAKNKLVADHYERLGFELVGHDERGSEWQLDISESYETRNTHIREISRG